MRGLAGYWEELGFYVSDTGGIWRVLSRDMT